MVMHNVVYTGVKVHVNLNCYKHGLNEFCLTDSSDSFYFNNAIIIVFVVITIHYYCNEA